MKLIRTKNLEKNKHFLNINRKINNKNIPLQKKRMKKYLKNELETSTTHGLSYFVNDRLHCFEKIFWIGNFIMCLVFAVLFLNVQYLRFITAPIVMSVEMNYFDWNISYPTITLCPLYKPDVAKFKSLGSQTYNNTGLPVAGYLWAISQAALDTMEFMDLNASEEVISLIHPKDYATLAASLFRKFQNSWLTTNTNWSITVDAAMTEMGMCHVINSNVALYDKPHTWNAFETAASVKNNIEISVFEADFVTKIMNYASVYKVFFHYPEDVTTITSSSFAFDVEGKISLGLSVWSNRISDALRTSSVYLRKCRFSHERTSQRYPIYSYSHCILECRIKMIQKICGCVPHFYKPLSHERICYIPELKCVLKYRKEIVTLQASEETLKRFHYADDLPRTSRDCGCLSTCDFDFYYKDKEDFEPKKGLNEVFIKITSFPKVRIVRDTIFDFYDIILKVGGVINLCIGGSIISIMEMLLTLIKICIYLFINIPRPRKNYMPIFLNKKKK